MNLHQLSIEKINIPVPPTFETILGYANCRKWVAFYWAPVVDRICFEDAYSGGYIKTDGWLAFLAHRCTQPAFAKYNLGSFDAEASHWLLLDRQDRVFYIGDGKMIYRFLKTFIDQIPFHSSKLFENPYSDMVKDEISGLTVSETFLDAIEIQNKKRDETKKINEMVKWLDMNC